MKRLWLIFTVLLLTVSACGTKSDNKSTTSQTGTYKKQLVTKFEIPVPSPLPF